MKPTPDLPTRGLIPLTLSLSLLWISCLKPQQDDDSQPPSPETEVSMTSGNPESQEDNFLKPAESSEETTVDKPVAAPDALAEATCNRLAADDRTIAPSERGELSSIFSELCSSCHGGRGQGAVIGPDIRQVSYQNFLFSVRNGRSGTMPAFDEGQYPQDILEQDFLALTGRQPVIEQDDCGIDVKADNPEISPSLNYKQVEQGPKALGLGFALDPFVLPYVTCKQMPAKDGSGMREVCANVSISGSTEEGYRFADFGVCKDIRTQRPYNPFVRVMQRSDFGDPEQRLADPEFAKELNWVTEQIRSSGCVCCHDSSVSRWTAYWDVNKGPMWIDQLDDYSLAVFSGKVGSTALGAYPSEDNYGFDRYHTGAPTTDVKRMQAFFNGLLDELGTSQEEIDAMPPLADFLGSQLREPVEACPEGVGISSEDMKIRWGNIFPARYVYVLEESAQNPLVTPNLDKPEGTLWRLDVPNRSLPLLSGQITYGEVPGRARQTIPDPERFETLKPLEKGKIYRLNVQLDMAFPIANCYFTFE